MNPTPFGDERWTTRSGRFGALSTQRDTVAAALGRASTDPSAVTKLFDISGAHLERAVDANTRLFQSPTLPASQRYTGVVHDHMNLAKMPTANRAIAVESVVIFSGLAGLVGIEDPMPDYRIKMGALLDPIGNLGRFWRDAIDAQLAALAPSLVIDLLPKEHAAAWSPGAIGVPVIRVQFLHVGPNGKRKIIGHDAKAAKGLLARHILMSSSVPAKAARTFRHDGWHLESSAPSAGITQLTYIRQTG